MSHAESGERYLADPKSHLQLEDAFRRLLNRYPAEYRAARADEMLATLMEASSPDQRRPSLADRVDLAWGAARAHLRLSLGPATVNATSAAALPAAVLLTGLLLQGVLSFLERAAMGARPSFHSLAFDPLNPLPRVVQGALYLFPLFVGVIMAVGLAARRPALTGAVAGIAAPILLAGPALSGWHVTGLLNPLGIGPGLLATIVAAAPRAALAQPRRRLALLALALVAVPMLSLITEHIVALRLMATAPPESSTPNIVFQIWPIGLAFGLLVTVALLHRWNDRALLASTLLLATLLPQFVALFGMEQSWSDDVRVPVAIGAEVFVLGTAAVAALLYRRSPRPAGPVAPRRAGA